MLYENTALYVNKCMYLIYTTASVRHHACGHSAVIIIQGLITCAQGFFKTLIEHALLTASMVFNNKATKNDLRKFQLLRSHMKFYF